MADLKIGCESVCESTNENVCESTSSLESMTPIVNVGNVPENPVTLDIKENKVTSSLVSPKQASKMLKGKRRAFSDYDDLFLSVFDTNKQLARETANKIFEYGSSEDISFRNEVKRNIDRLTHNFSLLPPTDAKRRIAILGYTVPNVEPWDPDSIKTGIAGSEEAIIYVGKEMASMGIEVVVYANPPKNSVWCLPVANPRYMSSNAFLSDDSKFDCVICWRRFDFHIASTKGPAYFWCHDIVGRKLPTEKLTGILFLSEYQRDHYYEYTPEMKSIPYTICGNGINLSQFPVESKGKSKRKPYSCAYISNYSRGLEILLDIWPQIKKAYPKASLGIYYGRETFGSCSKEVLDRIVYKIESLSKMDVVEHGKVGHVELAKALSLTSFWLYPLNNGSETFCISAVRASYASCIPICSLMGALKEVTHPDTPGIAGITCPDDIKKYLDVVLATMKLSEKELNRKKYSEFAKKFTWKACVDKMLQLIYEQKGDKPVGDKL